MTNLPPAVIAYLEEATIAVAQEQFFFPASEEEFSSWLKSNLPEVVLKAKELQFNCWLKLASNQKGHAQLVEIVQNRFWRTQNSIKNQ